MSDPLVSFVVPCYKLGHYLAECVESILSQTYRNLEVLIMDDCSPDNTPEVARSFTDPRVRYVRNDPNLGHLRNYNKGIEMSRGAYVWLISADDRVRVPDALSRYLAIMEANPNVGYACSSAVEVRSGQEIGLAHYSLLAKGDRILPGHKLLETLLYTNAIVAASGMVRKTCYTFHGAFPLDLPYAGDWYLWCLFALYYDVAYVAVPLVAYRIHEESMTETLLNENVQTCAEDEIAVLWRIERDASAAGLRSVAALAHRAISRQYAEQMTRKRYRCRVCPMDLRQLERSLDRYAADPRRKRQVLERVHASIGDIWYAAQDTDRAMKGYLSALRLRPWAPKVWAKLILLRMGRFGTLGRNAFARYIMRRSDRSELY